MWRVCHAPGGPDRESHPALARTPGSFKARLNLLGGNPESDKNIVFIPLVPARVQS